VGNEYVDVGGSSAITTVDGNGDTALWLGGETLEVTVAQNDTATTIGDGTRVVLVVESGVRDAATVTEVTT